MAGLEGQQESSTQLNSNVTAGDFVREVAVTPPSTGQVSKQQVVALGDPVAADALATVSLAGEQYVRADEVTRLLAGIYKELRATRYLMSRFMNEYVDPDNVPVGDAQKVLS